MKILVLPNALKGSLSAREFIKIAQKTLARKQYTVRAFPISDGGDGLLDFFRSLDPSAKSVFLQAKNAFLRNQRTSFLLLSDGETAVIETARVCGLGSADKAQLDPLGASSYGVGQVILAAVRRGAKRIYIGLGGVACNDGGAGMAVACGAKLWDKKGHSLPLGAQPLLQLKKVDLSNLSKQLKGIKIIGIADVKNTLLGKYSSAKVFGPQKGATPAQVKILDKAMATWARLVEHVTDKNIAYVPATAAAGAIGAGIYGCFPHSKLCLGAEELFKRAHLEKQVKWADLIITAEGKLDRQTFFGKAPHSVLNLARKYKKNVLFVCGQADWKVLEKQRLSHVQVAQLVDFASNVEDSQKHAGRYVARVLKSV